MATSFRAKSVTLAASVAAIPIAVSLAWGHTAADEGAESKPWMAPALVSEQAGASSDTQREAVASQRASLLLEELTLAQKMQQLTGSEPEIVPELPQCFGARHVSGIAELAIPTLRITNGPVGVGQNDCVSREIYDALVAGEGEYERWMAYTHPSSAKATALPAALGVAASFDPAVATDFGLVIATEMNNMALHVFEAPGLNLARLPVLGRNFEYFGEDPYLAGVMGVAEVKAIQREGLIAMPKHFVANEQETRRQTIQEAVDEQILREIYLLPFEMAVRDGRAAAIMCAYNYVNGVSSCENEELLTGVLRDDWGFTGYVQSDFFAMKSTAETLRAGMDHEMATPLYWAPEKLTAALSNGEISTGHIDTALERRYTQMFKAGIFDRPIVQTPIDYEWGGEMARKIGTRSAVLLQNNGALPLDADVQTIAVVGKASQVYAQQAVAGGALTGEPMGSGGGSSDVVPAYTVTPVEGLGNALESLGNTSAEIQLVLVDDDNSTATVNGESVSFTEALDLLGASEAIVIMAGTISEEGADRATFETKEGLKLADDPAAGTSLDWYADRSNLVATAQPDSNPAKNSNTVAMIREILRATSSTDVPMVEKSVLVLKDNAGVAMEPEFVGSSGPSILEVWFPGQEDGNIVADLLFGIEAPGGKLPVTFPFVGKGFLDNVTTLQFPGEALSGNDGQQGIAYSEGLLIGYRWYDANESGECGEVEGRNPCIAFPFGHGLSYTDFEISDARLSYDAEQRVYTAGASVSNVGKRGGSEVLQAYVELPASASEGRLPQSPKRLVGFRKVELDPGAVQTIEIEIDPAATNHPLSIWNADEDRWEEPAGTYTVWVGNSSAKRDLIKAGSFTLPSKK